MVTYLIILVAILTRFLPHEANIGVITAIAIFAGAYLPRKQAIVIPLAARFVSDIFLGFFSWPLMMAVYASHLLGVLFGMWIQKHRAEPDHWFRVITSALGSSAIFFFLTNFAFLYPEYPHTFGGIILSYANGLPFLRGTIVGDVGYSIALFGAYELARLFISKRFVANPSIST